MNSFANTDAFIIDYLRRHFFKKTVFKIIVLNKFIIIVVSYESQKTNIKVNY